MGIRTSAVGKPDFGLDAPPVIYTFLGVAAVGVVLGGAGLLFSLPLLAFFGLVPLAIGLLTASAMTLSSRLGKIALRDKLLDDLFLEDKERVLDLGCGRGLMLLGMVARMSGGEAVGIDLWRAGDQKGTSRRNCLENARRLGVADRVNLVDGDMRFLPFPENSFDVVTASLAIHNISDREGRRKTMDEVARVLRPGGSVLIVDFSKTEEYAEDAHAAGLVDVRRSSRKLLMYPLVRVVSASKSGVREVSR